MASYAFAPCDRGDLVICMHERPLTVAQFERVPPPAIGLEAVDGPPAWLPNRWSADHHAAVPRPFYDCVAKQVLVATDAGLWHHLTHGMSGAPVHVHIVRTDEDVALSMALLTNPGMASNRALRRLVELEDALDRSGGTFCGDATDDELGRIAWIFQPYHLWRSGGRAPSTDAALRILKQVGERVEAFTAGQSRLAPVEGRIDILARTGPVALIVEHGPYARLALRREGIEAYMAVRTEGGRRIVTIGLTDVFVPLDLLAVYAELNRLEGRRHHGIPTTQAGGDRWGGGTHVGGSPFTGTQLDAETILAVMVDHHRTITITRSRTRDSG
jgi:hypothetical protein